MKKETLASRLQKTPCVSGSKATREERLRAEQRDAERPALDERGGHEPGMREGREKQRVGPYRKAGQHAGDGAARRGAPPDEPAEEARRELRDGREGEQADRGERRAARHAVIGVAEQQDDDDRGAPDVEDEAPHVGRQPARCRCRAGSAGTTISLEIMMASATLATITMAVAAERPPMKAISVIAELPAARGSSSTKRSASTLVAERQQARRGDRHDEDVDGDEIGGKQPGRAADLAGAVVLHHRDVELPRQQQAGDEAEQGLREPAPRPAGRDRISRRSPGVAAGLRDRGRRARRTCTQVT